MGQGVKWAATLYLWLNGESFPPWSVQAPSPQWTWHARRHSSMDTSITLKSSLRYIVYLWSKKGQHQKWFSTVFDRFDCDFQSLSFHFLTTEKPQLRLLWISWDFLGLKEECCLFTGPFYPFCSKTFVHVTFLFQRKPRRTVIMDKFLRSKRFCVHESDWVKDFDSVYVLTFSQFETSLII